MKTTSESSKQGKNKGRSEAEALWERGEDIIWQALNSECRGELCQKQTGELSLSMKEVGKEQEGDRDRWLGFYWCGVEVRWDPTVKGQNRLMLSYRN